MRAILILLLLLALCAMMHAAENELIVKTGLAWTDNAFELSDHDLARFEDGSSVFDFINTSDDFIISPSIRWNHTRDFYSSELSFFLDIGSEYYTSNGDKSRSDYLTGLGFDWEDWHLDLMYGFYPDNFTREYTDNDGTMDSEQFLYDKNLYKASVWWRFPSRTIWFFYGKYEEYKHSEHWTEYDGYALTGGLGWKYTFSSFYLKLFYYYRSYVCDNLPDSYDDPDNPDAKDASYDSNQYSVDLRTKKIRLAKRFYLRPFYSFDFEDKFYQTDIPYPFHANRHDQEFVTNLGCVVYAVKNLDITMYYKHVFRKSESDFYPDIDDYKEFVKDQYGLTLEYRFEF